MTKYAIFGDTQVEVLNTLRTSLSFLEVSNVRVSIKRTDPDAGRNILPEVIVRNNGGFVFDTAMKEEDFTLFLYTQEDTELEALKLADSLTGSLMTALQILPGFSKNIKSIINAKSTVIEDQGLTQVRSIIFTTISSAISVKSTKIIGE